MNYSKNSTAGETAVTNNFDAEIVRLKQERDGKFAEIQERIDRLAAQNTNMNTLRRLNEEQIRALTIEKEAIGKEYKHKIAAIDEKKNDYYCNRISSVHYQRFAAFCDLHPEVLEMWREFRQAEENQQSGHTCIDCSFAGTLRNEVAHCALTHAIHHLPYGCGNWQNREGGEQ